MSHRVRSILGIAALAFATTTASAQQITVGIVAAPTSADPHFHAVTPNAQFRRHIHEGLLAADERNRAVPELAASWEKVSDTVWRFRLRQGVVFHDGTPFSARDVIYSYCRVPNVPNSPGLYRPYISSIKAMRSPDPLTLEIETNGPAPNLADDLTNIGIISAAAAGAPESVTYDGGTCGITQWPATAEFNSVGRVAVGTGPYRLVSFSSSDESVLVRFDGYWGRKPDHERVVMKVLTNNGARTASLLSGAVDVIERPPLENLDRLKADARLTVAQSPSANIIYMSFDQALEPSPQVGGTGGKNPLKDVRVRRAISMAINRDAIVQRTLYGLGVPAHQMAAPSMFGFDPTIPAERFDPEGARRLLAEAGWPNGFELTIATPTARYQYDVEIAQALAQMLTRIGIKASVEQVPSAVYFTNATNQKYSFFLAGVGANMGEAFMLLRALGHSRTGDFGTLNRGRYSNPELDRIIVEGLRTMDDDRREQLNRQALQIFTRDRGVLPIHQETTLWAMKKGLTYTGRADQMLLVHEVRRAN